MIAVTTGPRAQQASLLGIWFAIILHASWAISLAFSASAARATALHGLVIAIPNRAALVALLIAVVALAVYGVLRHETTPLRIASLIPQQTVLGVSSGSAVYAMCVGHAADGVAHPHALLITAQSPIVIAFLIHTVTIVYLASVRWKH